MNRTAIVCIFLCLAPISPLGQSNLVGKNNSSARGISPKSSSHNTQTNQKGILLNYGKLPLSFEANHGQIDARVKFLSRSNGRSFFLTKDQAVLVLAGGGQSSYQSGSVLRMKFRHSNPDAKVSGLDELPGKNNYFIGSDPAKWHSDIPSYAKVKYEELYSGIDLLFYGNQRQLEYDFIIAPGADSSRIGFDVSGAQSVHLDERGAMVFKLGENEVRWQQPLAY